MAGIKTISEMQLDGGVPCLDFINSGYDTENGVVVEKLHSYTDLLILAERVSIIDKGTSKKLAKLSAKLEVEAIQVLVTAKQVRQLMFGIFSAIARKEPGRIDRKNLDAFNTFLLPARASEGFELVNGKLQVGPASAAVNLMFPLWAFLNSAFYLLRDDEQQYIKQCAACAWLFLDQTKNHRRKWCDMQTCGSIEKSKRYYRRKKKA